MSGDEHGGADEHAEPVVRVLIVDDHRVFADAVAVRLSAEPDIEVVGTAYHPEQALDALDHNPVDVVVLDLDLAGQDGLELGRRLLQRHPAVAVVIVTGLPDDAGQVLRAVQLGIRCWVTKSATVDMLLAGIRSAARGETHLPADMLTEALVYLSTGAPPLAPEVEAVNRLTRRERDVLHGLMEGLSRNEIGERLRVSPNTVRTHVQSILSKLHVHSALSAVALARKAGVTIDH
ncbi:MAG TPA: response regulator transcription factor [Dermatophilaceae bacterium]|nr:response regulator transcription factor [Dermatophilaceae bacterium]